MSTEERAPLNWVEKRLLSEEHLANSGPGLWRDICGALTDAVRTYNRKCDGSVQVNQVNGHRFTIIGPNNARIDIDFDDQAHKVNATYSTEPFRFRNFVLRADSESAFITDDQRNRLAPDDVSKAILEAFLFAGRS